MAAAPFTPTSSVRDAIEALQQGRLVLAPESPEAWSEVSTIEPLREKGVLTPAYRIRFASGHGRVTEGGEQFRLSDR
jgi:hypothetical protein